MKMINFFFIFFFLLISLPSQNHFTLSKSFLKLKRVDNNCKSINLYKEENKNLNNNKNTYQPDIFIDEIDKQRPFELEEAKGFMFIIDWIQTFLEYKKK